MAGLRLIKAEKLTLKRRAQECATCETQLSIGTEVWKEKWSDLGQVATDYLCLQCDGEEETREEYRNALLAHLANDPG